MRHLIIKEKDYATDYIVISSNKLSCQSHYQGQMREYKLYVITDFKEYDKMRNIINLTAYFYAKEIK